MSLTQIEQQYLSTRPRGHLATGAPGGSPQVKPVGFAYNTELGAIEITGFAMAATAKYRNIRANPNVALVVDDVLAGGIEGVRFLEIRGVADAVAGMAPTDSDRAEELIRILRVRRCLGRE
jgi:pyridoxamine 5'-phosphate oxidase family protein